MKVRVKRNLKEGEYVQYNHFRYKNQGASVVNEMLKLRGRMINVFSSDIPDIYLSTDSDYVWHRSWFEIPRKPKKVISKYQHLIDDIGKGYLPSENGCKLEMTL